MDQSMLGAKRSAEHGFTFTRRSAEHGFTFTRRSAEHGFTFTRRSAEHGFTLLEMIVALAVFSIAALALLRLEGATVKNAAEVETRTLGQIVANNIAVDALTDPLPPPLGKSEGVVENGGRTWRWVRIATRTADVRIVRIDIIVSDQNGRAGGRLSLARVAQ
jgi:general secretion pathway protein I